MWVVLAVLLALLAVVAAAGGQSTCPETDDTCPSVDRLQCLQALGWNGGELDNSNHARAERAISPENVSRLGVKWMYETQGGDVSGQVAAHAGVLYFVSWKNAPGKLHAVNATNGLKLWSFEVVPKYFSDEHAPVPCGANFDATAPTSRTTPVLDPANDRLFIGSLAPSTRVACVRMSTGAHVWTTPRLDEALGASITLSPTLFEGVLYGGVAGSQGDCGGAAFRGSVFAMRADNGTLKWQTYMVTQQRFDEGGFTGNGVWGSAPAIDLVRRRLIVATGNTQQVPGTRDPVFGDIQGNLTQWCADRATCKIDGVYGNAIVALDLENGVVAWATQTRFLVEQSEGDMGFPHAPILASRPLAGSSQELAIAMDKRGRAYAVDLANGTLLWQQQLFGFSINFGGALDDEGRVFFSGFEPGSWVALNVSDGSLLWRTESPDARPSVSAGPLAYANGLLYGSGAQTTAFALDSRNGSILWSRAISSSSVNAAPRILNGALYWGQGYGRPATLTNKFWAFDLCDSPPSGVNLVPNVLDAEIRTEILQAGTCDQARGCAKQLGQPRRLLRFRLVFSNVGTSDLVIGSPATSALFEPSQCDGTLEIPHFASYRLLPLNSNVPVGSGEHFTFCLEDVVPPATGSPLPSSGLFNCSYQGVHSGWSDNYGPSNACQYIDVTDVPIGSYRLEVSINARRTIAETSYDDNSVSLLVEVSPPPAACDAQELAAIFTHPSCQPCLSFAGPFDECPSWNACFAALSTLPLDLTCLDCLVSAVEKNLSALQFTQVCGNVPPSCVCKSALERQDDLVRAVEFLS